MKSRSTLEYLAVPSLPDLLVAARAEHAEQPALSIGDTRWTFSDLYERATLAARGLSALGVVRHSRVGIYMGNCPEFVEILLGASMLGAVVVPINNRFRSRELAHIQNDAQLQVVVTISASAEHGDYPRRLRRALATLDTESVNPVVVVFGTGRPDCDDVVDANAFYALAEGVCIDVVERARAAIRLRDVAAILYTSGTTAMPKGCLHTHEALVRNGIVTGRSRFLLTTQDRFWDPLPMFHVSFLTPMVACLDAGAEMLSMRHFEPEAALQLIEDRRATWLFAAFQAIAGGIMGAESFGRRRLDSVRMTMCVGHTPDLRRFQSAFPKAQLLSTYGSTETAGVITYHTPDSHADQRVSTCGTPFRGVEIAIRNLESDDHLAPEEVGEILVRGYSVLDGYLNDPVGTAAVVDVDGWLHTGDLGMVDSNGHLVFQGRLKDVMKVGGENVSAAEIEELLSEHPAVLIAHVVGAPDRRLDEVVAAFVEVRAGFSTSPKELIDYCAARIAAYKVPRHVRFLEEWPMSATKVRKDELRRRIAAELAELAGAINTAPERAGTK